MKGRFVVGGWGSPWQVWGTVAAALIVTTSLAMAGQSGPSHDQTAARLLKTGLRKPVVRRWRVAVWAGAGCSAHAGAGAVLSA